VDSPGQGDGASAHRRVRSRGSLPDANVYLTAASRPASDRPRRSKRCPHYVDFAAARSIDFSRSCRCEAPEPASFARQCRHTSAPGRPSEDTGSARWWRCRRVRARRPTPRPYRYRRNRYLRGRRNREQKAPTDAGQAGERDRDSAAKPVSAFRMACGHLGPSMDIRRSVQSGSA
jgi:hypothetical protein